MGEYLRRLTPVEMQVLTHPDGIDSFNASRLPGLMQQLSTQSDRQLQILMLYCISLLTERDRSRERELALSRQEGLNFGSLHDRLNKALRALVSG